MLAYVCITFHHHPHNRLTRGELFRAYTMATPVIVDIVTYFYPVGNTSAVHLTRNLPQEQTARILLLGCGDVRNIVFTVYMDQDSGKQIPPSVFDFRSDTAQQVGVSTLHAAISKPILSVSIFRPASSIVCAYTFSPQYLVAYARIGRYRRWA
jgi:hypothetical protein